MESSSLIDELRELGFNEYKAKVFLVLLKGKLMNATDIAKEAKIVRTSIYDILKIFVEKGYCNEIETNRILQYQIIDPEIILDKIERDYNTSNNQKIKTLKSTFRKILPLYKENKGDELNRNNIELIRGYNKQRISKYIELLKNAKTEICGMYRFKGIVMDELDEIAEKFMKNGGVLKSIYEASLDFKIQKGFENKDATVDDLIMVCSKFEEQGEQIRLTRLNIPNITIIDKKNVFINLDDKWVPRQSQADIILRRTNLANSMLDLFNYYWDNSMTLTQFKKKAAKK
jgi:sugar-specific transcriptional regulator TrmB